MRILCQSGRSENSNYFRTFQLKNLKFYDKNDQRISFYKSAFKRIFKISMFLFVLAPTNLLGMKDRNYFVRLTNNFLSLFFSRLHNNTKKGWKLIVFENWADLGTARFLKQTFLCLFIMLAFLLPFTSALPKNGSIKITEIVFFKYFYISRYLLYFFVPSVCCRNIYFSFSREILSLRHFFKVFLWDRLKSRFWEGPQNILRREHSSTKEIFHSWKRSWREKIVRDGCRL